jgi:hypothetical protein
MIPNRVLNFFFLTWLLVGLSACALFDSAPETPTEQLATLELGYQEVLKAAITWRDEGRLSESDIERFDRAFDTYETYRNAARAAILLGNEIRAGEAVSQTSGALSALRQLLTEYE